MKSIKWFIRSYKFYIPYDAGVVAEGISLEEVIRRIKLLKKVKFEMLYEKEYNKYDDVVYDYRKNISINLDNDKKYYIIQFNQIEREIVIECNDSIFRDVEFYHPYSVLLKNSANEYYFHSANMVLHYYDFEENKNY